MRTAAGPHGEGCDSSCHLKNRLKGKQKTFTRFCSLRGTDAQESQGKEEEEKLISTPELNYSSLLRAIAHGITRSPVAPRSACCGFVKRAPALPLRRMARDNAARCRALSLLGNSWLVAAAAILLVARGKTKHTRAARLKRSLKAAPASSLRAERGALQLLASPPRSSSLRVFVHLCRVFSLPYLPHVVKVHG